MLHKVEPRRTLQTAKYAAWYEHTRKRQNPRNQNERAEEVAARDYENGPRAQNGKLDEQQDRGDRIAHEHCRRIGWNEGSDLARLETRKRPSFD